MRKNIVCYTSDFHNLLLLPSYIILDMINAVQRTDVVTI